MEYLIVKWLHVVSSTILFGTGIGSAFYMLVSVLSKDTRVIAHTVGMVVLADWIFTTPAIFVQPVTGLYLMHLAGYPFSQHWILLSIALYFFAGACWLPVVWLQMRMHAMAKQAMENDGALPASFGRYFRYWVLLGIPAFFALVVVFYLMVAKPA